MAHTDQRHALEDIRSPHQNDVLYGRGGGTNNHFGNSQWRNIISMNKKRYHRLPKRKKMLLAQSIVLQIRQTDPPGRFLQRDPKSKLWYDVGDKKARDKTSHALREGAKDIRDEMINEGSDHSDDDDLIENNLRNLSLPDPKPSNKGKTVEDSSSTPAAATTTTPVAAASCPLSHSRPNPVTSSTPSSSLQPPAKKNQGQKIHLNLPQASERRSTLEKPGKRLLRSQPPPAAIPPARPPPIMQSIPISAIASMQSAKMKGMKMPTAFYPLSSSSSSAPPLKPSSPSSSGTKATTGQQPSSASKVMPPPAPPLRTSQAMPPLVSATIPWKVMPPLVSATIPWKVMPPPAAPMITSKVMPRPAPPPTTIKASPPPPAAAAITSKAMPPPLPLTNKSTSSINNNVVIGNGDHLHFFAPRTLPPDPSFSKTTTERLLANDDYSSTDIVDINRMVARDCPFSDSHQDDVTAALKAVRTSLLDDDILLNDDDDGCCCNADGFLFDYHSFAGEETTAIPPSSSSSSAAAAAALTKKGRGMATTTTAATTGVERSISINMSDIISLDSMDLARNESRGGQTLATIDSMVFTEMIVKSGAAVRETTLGRGRSEAISEMSFTGLSRECSMDMTGLSRGNSLALADNNNNLTLLSRGNSLALADVTMLSRGDSLVPSEVLQRWRGDVSVVGAAAAASDTAGGSTGMVGGHMNHCHVPMVSNTTFGTANAENNKSTAASHGPIVDTPPFPETIPPPLPQRPSIPNANENSSGRGMSPPEIPIVDETLLDRGISFAFSDFSDAIGEINTAETKETFASLTRD